MKTYIVVKTNFEATHQWSTCPIESVKYLRHPHRHIFYVTMKWQVVHENRAIEFIDMKHKVERYIRLNFTHKFLGDMSCEMMCADLQQAFHCSFVSVFEDNENGAELYE